MDIKIELENVSKKDILELQNKILQLILEYQKKGTVKSFSI